MHWYIWVLIIGLFFALLCFALCLLKAGAIADQQIQEFIEEKVKK